MPVIKIEINLSQSTIQLLKDLFSNSIQLQHLRDELKKSNDKLETAVKQNI